MELLYDKIKQTKKIHMSSNAVPSVACWKVLSDNILYEISKHLRKGSNAKYGTQGRLNPLYGLVHSG